MCDSSLGESLMLTSSCSELKEKTARLFALSSSPWESRFPLHPPTTKSWRYCARGGSPQVRYGGFFFGRKGANRMVSPGGTLLLRLTASEILNIVFFNPFDRRSGGHTFLLARISGWPPKRRLKGYPPEAQRISGRKPALWGAVRREE